jgi:hypothetical protein
LHDILFYLSFTRIVRLINNKRVKSSKTRRPYIQTLLSLLFDGEEGEGGRGRGVREEC